MSIAQFLEAAMLICFSLSWYWSILKMLRTRSAHGKSLHFVLMVSAGYAFGISAKLLAWTQGSELAGLVWLYGWNLLVTSFDAVLIVRYTERPRPPAPSPAARTTPPRVVLRRRVAA